jgi:predicted ArsR family transcriptional regulator
MIFGKNARVRSQRPGERIRTQAGADVDARRRAVLHGTSRSHVLETLHAADAPLSVTEVAGRVGLHPNTIRWHLDQLAGAGWVTRAAKPRAGQGRPRVACAAGGDAFPACDEEGSGQGYRLLDDLGFAPEPDPGSGLITLHACLFREVAEAHPEDACAVHLGLMQGALAGPGAPAMTRLEPFVTLRQCRAHLVPDPAASPAAAAEEVSTRD